MPFAALGAGIAAVVAAAFIMLKGGMVEKPAFAGGGLGPESQGGSAMGVGDIGDDGEPLDPFKRFARARQAGGPAATQSETQQLYNDTWGDSGGDEPSVSFGSEGDGSTYGPSTGTTYPAGWWNPETTPTAPWSQPGDAPTSDYGPSHDPAPTRGMPGSSSPTPVVTSDPTVYRVPGTNIKMT